MSFRSLALAALVAALLMIVQARLPHLVGGSVDERLYRHWGNQVAQTVEPGHFEQLAIVVIDDSSLGQLNLPWPLPRGLYAPVVDKLTQAGAKTVGLDLLFLDPGPSLEADAILDEVLQRSEVLAPFTLASRGDRLVPQPSVFRLNFQGSGFAQSQMAVAGPYASGDRLPEVRYAVLRLQRNPVDLFGEPVVEDDQAVREDYVAWAVALWAHFSELEPAQVIEGIAAERAQVPFESFLCQADFGRIRYLPPGLTHQVRLAPQVEVQPGQVTFVDVAGEAGPGRVAAADYVQVLRLQELLEISPERLAERFGHQPFLAVVGVAVEGQDLKTTPVGDMHGVEVQANILLNLMHNNFVLPCSLQLGFLLIGVLAGLGVGLGQMKDARLGGLFLAGTLVVFYSLAQAAFVAGGFFSRGWTVPVVVPALALALAYGGALILKVHRQRNRIETVLTMLREVCPVADLDRLEQKQAITLGGEERELTILFSDLRGYTSFAEKLDSVTVLETLNRYFGAVGDILERHGGCVFDYQGDAQMVVFGLMPASQEDHAGAACQAALAMIGELENKRAEWEKEGRGIPDTGVGIATGPVSFGFLGTAHRKQRVAIGDPTNTAARIQGKSSELGYRVLITEATRRSARQEFSVVALAPVAVKGKSEPLKLFALESSSNSKTVD